MSMIKFLLCGLVLSAPAFAFKLTPIEAEFALGRQSVQTFKVDNIGGSGPVAVEITVSSRQMAKDGSDQLASAPDDFVVFPDQIVLQPGETQSVRVQWTGDQPPASEKAYRLIAEQLPIDLAGAGADRSGLKLMVKYLAALYVRPVDPAAVLTATVAAEAGEGDPSIRMVLHNTGSAHVVLQAPMVVLSVDGKPIEFSPEQRELLHGKNVLAGVEREFLLPWPKGVGQGALTVELKSPPAGQ